jgi:hypothetical protein
LMSLSWPTSTRPCRIVTVASWRATSAHRNPMQEIRARFREEEITNIISRSAIPHVRPPGHPERLVGRLGLKVDRTDARRYRR